MRGIVAPSTPCCPRTSAAAFSNFRSDSRLRSCCGSSVFLDLGMESLYQPGPVRVRGISISQKSLTFSIVNVNSHLHRCKSPFTSDRKPKTYGNSDSAGTPVPGTQTPASSEESQLCSVVDGRDPLVVGGSVLHRRPA